MSIDPAYAARTMVREEVMSISSAPITREVVREGDAMAASDERTAVIRSHGMLGPT